VVPTATILVFLVAIVASETRGYLAGLVISIIVVGSASLAVILLGEVIFG
jgi:hypothetical protein